MAGDLKRQLRDIVREDDGSVSYTGQLYRMGGDAADVKRLRTQLTWMLPVIAAVAAGSGLIDAAGASNSVYVILPYIGEVAAAFVLIWNMARLIHAGDAVRDYVLESAVPRASGAVNILIFFAAAGCTMSCLWLARNGTGGRLAASISYPLLKAVSAACAVCYSKLLRSVNWETR